MAPLRYLLFAVLLTVAAGLVGYGLCYVIAGSLGLEDRLFGSGMTLIGLVIIVSVWNNWKSARTAVPDR